MNTTTSTQPLYLKGGEWLIKESNAFDTFTPEDFNEEQLMVKDMCLQFLLRKYCLLLTGWIKWKRALCHH
jgi:hypothetical protein